MDLFSILLDKKKRRKLSHYFLYIFKKPGIESAHLYRIIAGAIVVIIILAYYVFSYSTANRYYLLFIIFYIYELFHFYLKFKRKYFNENIYTDFKFKKDIKIFQKLELSEKHKHEGWKLTSFNKDKANSIAMYSDMLNALIIRDLSHFKIVVNKNKYKSVLKYIKDNWESIGIYLQYKALHSFIKNKDFFNDNKVCLGSDISKDKNALDIYFGSYFDSVVTNEACGSIYENTVTGVVAHPISTSIFTDSNKILELSASYCNNHIGISTLAISKDNKIVVWRQNSKTQHNSDQYIPTASGSMDKNDMYTGGIKTDSFEQLVINATNRELREESTIKNENIVATKVIGYWRWVERGAKPEFISLTLLNIDSSELQPDIKELKQTGENHKFYLDIKDPQFEQTVNKRIENSESSLPLSVALSFLLNFKKNSDQFNNFLSLACIQ